MDKNKTTVQTVSEDTEVGMMILYRTKLYNEIKRAVYKFEKRSAYVAKGYACITVPQSKVESIANAIHQIDKNIRISIHSMEWKRKKKTPTNNTAEVKKAAKKKRKDSKNLKKTQKVHKNKYSRKAKKKQNKTLEQHKLQRVKQQSAAQKTTSQNQNKQLKKAA